MRTYLLLLFLFWLTCAASQASAQSKPGNEEVVELQITPAFSPEDLSELIQKLGKRGVLLRFEETGYCNGQLRILKGEIIGTDGSRQGFETQALKRLNIQLVARTKTLGISAVRIKSRWKKCRAEEPEEVHEKTDEPEPEPSPIRQI